MKSLKIKTSKIEVLTIKEKMRSLRTEILKNKTLQKLRSSRIEVFKN